MPDSEKIDAIQYEGVSIHELSRDKLIEALKVGFGELSILRDSQSEEGRAAAAREEDFQKSLRAQHDYFGAVAEYQSRLMDAATAYNQIIILGGYVAFFGVWSAVQNDIPRWILLTSGSAILLSLVVFIGWTVFNMFQLQTQNMKTLATFSDGVEGFEGRYQAALADGLQDMGWFRKLWVYVVVAASSAALVAALLLSFGALASIFSSKRESPNHSVVATNSSQKLAKSKSTLEPSSATPDTTIDFKSQKAKR